MVNKLLATILSFIIVWESIPVSNLYAQTANVGSVTFNSIGIPQGSVPRSDVDYTKLSNRIKANLPETVQVNSKFLSDDVSKTNIELRKDANVYVTFLFEGAGYVNWFGYFLFSSIPASATATTVYPIFPNVDNSVLPLGTRIKIGNFKKGQKIGFVVVSDGYARPSDKSTILNGPVPWGYRTNGTAPKSKFFSLNSLNPAATVAKAGVDTVGKPMQRVAYQWDAENKLGVISFDDQLTGDYDFNDVTFTVDSDPADAIVPDDNVVVIGTVKVCHVDDKGKDTEYSFDLPTKQADYDLHKGHPDDFQGGCKDKVNICHYPPGNPSNPQNITIGAPAVNDHIGLHEFDAVVENKNVVCPAKYPACSSTGTVIWQNSAYDTTAAIKLTKNGNDYTCTKDICKAGAKVNVTLPYTLKEGESEMVNNSCPVTVIPTPTPIPTAEPVPTVAETLCEGGVAKIKDGPNKVCPISYCHYPPGNLNNPQLMTNMPPSSWEGSGNGNSGHSSHEKDILLTAGKTDCPSFIDVCRDGHS